MEEHDEAAQPRKSLYMRLAPIIHTYDEVIKNKLESGKFPLTRTGIIKVLGMLCLMASIGLFFGTPLCAGTSSWYPYLFPSSITTTLIFLVVLYVVFSSGCTTRKPAVWVKIDIAVNLILPFISIFCTVASMCDCGNGNFSQIIIGVAGICGCIISIIGGISIFLMYRFVDETPLQPQESSRRPVDPRKSVFA